MQVAQAASEPEGAGYPEFSELGRKLEVLRIQRGISKQHLARFAGISRQQLWRVMTGKSELTPSLRERLAQSLGVAGGELAPHAQPNDAVVAREGPLGSLTPQPPVRPGQVIGPSEPIALPAATLADYLADPACLPRTMASLPAGPDGLRLKRQLLNALEDVALERSLALSSTFFEVRRQVLAGEL